MVEPKEQSCHGLTIKQLFSNSSFWVLMVVMVCASASELSISQWASAFVEAGLNVDKTIGDLFRPCGFALMMGISRTIYGKYGHGLNLTTS